MSNPATRRKSVTEYCTVVSSVHPCKHCQPCILCKKGNRSKYFHPKTWKYPSLLPCLQEYKPLLETELDSCICRSCSNDIKCLSRNGFVPRWRKSQSNSSFCVCVVPGCNDTVYKVTRLVDRVTVSKFFVNIRKQ